MKNRNVDMIKKLLTISSYVLLVCGSAAIADDRPTSGDIKYIRGPKNAEDILPLGRKPGHPLFWKKTWTPIVPACSCLRLSHLLH